MIERLRNLWKLSEYTPETQPDPARPTLLVKEAHIPQGMATIIDLSDNLKEFDSHEDI